MKTLLKIAVATIAAATPAYASAGQPESYGMLLTLFFGFAALIIVFQAVPALILLFGMVKGILSPASPPAAQGKRS